MYPRIRKHCTGPSVRTPAHLSCVTEERLCDASYRTWERPRRRTAGQQRAVQTSERPNDHLIKLFANHRIGQMDRSSRRPRQIRRRFTTSKAYPRYNPQLIAMQTLHVGCTLAEQTRMVLNSRRRCLHYGQSVPVDDRQGDSLRSEGP